MRKGMLHEVAAHMENREGLSSTHFRHITFQLIIIIGLHLQNQSLKRLLNLSQIFIAKICVEKEPGDWCIEKLVCMCMSMCVRYV